MKEHLAFMVFCISRDLLQWSVEKAQEEFTFFLESSGQHLHRDREAIIDIILHDARQDIKMGISYGKYDEQILEAL